MKRRDAIILVKEGLDVGKTNTELKKELMEKGYDPIDAGQLVLDAPNEKVKVRTKEISENNLRKRNYIFVALFCIFTAGLYGLYWIIDTSKEFSKKSKNPPNPKLLFMLLIPGINAIIWIIYLWKFTKVHSEITESNKGIIFLFLFFLFPLGIMMCQMDINGLKEEKYKTKII